MAYEDFTTYTEVDGGGSPGYLAVSENVIDANDVLQNSDTYVYADKTASHFGATFEHDLTVKTISWKANSWDAMGVWCVTNTVDDINGLDGANSQAVFLMVFANYADPNNNFYIENGEDDTSDISTNFVLNTTYYLNIDRTSETALHCDIYKDSIKTDLLDTITIAVPTGRRYRYIMSAQSYNNTAAIQGVTADISNLDLNEGGGGVVKTINGLAIANVKTIGGLAIGSVKTYNGAATQ